MNPKRCVDEIKWSEHKKQTNTIHFECTRRYIAREMKYFKHTHPSKMTAVQVGKTLVYSLSFIFMVGYSISIIDPSISQVLHVKGQELIKDHLISKIWGGI